MAQIAQPQQQPAPLVQQPTAPIPQATPPQQPAPTLPKEPKGKSILSRVLDQILGRKEKAPPTTVNVNVTSQPTPQTIVPQNTTQ